MTTLNTTPKIKSDSNLKPFSKEVEIDVYRVTCDINVSPNILMKVIKDDPNTFLPPDWEFNQTIFDKLMEESISEDSYSFWEGDLDEVSWFMENEIHGGCYEYEGVNQKWLWEHKIKYSLCNHIGIWNEEKTKCTYYYTPKIEYGGLGKEYLIERLKETIDIEMSPIRNKLTQLQEMENELNQKEVN